MGTLFNQPSRNEFVTDITPERVVLEVKTLAEAHSITFEQALCCYRESTRRSQLNRYVQNGDIKDEQLCGFGELIQELIRVFES